MSSTKVNYHDVESYDGLHFLREDLDCEQLGFSIMDVDDVREGLEHDHSEDGQEEVYFLVDGEAELIVDGEAITMAPGDAIRVAPEATRDLTMLDDSLMVIVGAP